MLRIIIMSIFLTSVVSAEENKIKNIHFVAQENFSSEAIQIKTMRGKKKARVITQHGSSKAVIKRGAGKMQLRLKNPVSYTTYEEQDSELREVKNIVEKIVLKRSPKKWQMIYVGTKKIRMSEDESINKRLRYKVSMKRVKLKPLLKSKRLSEKSVYLPLPTLKGMFAKMGADNKGQGIYLSEQGKALLDEQQGFDWQASKGKLRIKSGKAKIVYSAFKKRGDLYSVIGKSKIDGKTTIFNGYIAVKKSSSKVRLKKIPAKMTFRDLTFHFEKGSIFGWTFDKKKSYSGTWSFDGEEIQVTRYKKDSFSPTITTKKEVKTCVKTQSCFVWNKRSYKPLFSIGKKHYYVRVMNMSLPNSENTFVDLTYFK